MAVRLARKLAPQSRKPKMDSNISADTLKAIECAISSLEWAAMVIKDIPENSAYMENIRELKAIVAEEKAPEVKAINIELINSINDLIEWVNHNFDCRVGVFMTHTPHESGMLVYDEINESFPMFETFGSPTKNYQARLVTCFRLIAMRLNETKKELGIDKPILYWRYVSKVMIEKAESNKSVAVYTRVAIPGALRNKKEELK